MSIFAINFPNADFHDPPAASMAIAEEIVDRAEKEFGWRPGPCNFHNKRYCMNPTPPRNHRGGCAVLSPVTKGLFLRIMELSANFVYKH